MQQAATVKDVMKAFIDGNGLTQQQFADEITASFVNTNISRVSVTNWCN